MDANAYIIYINKEDLVFIHITVVENLLKIQNNYPKYVVTMDEFKGNVFDLVQCLRLV
ncbi:hypothetical protein ACIO08_10265 [Avibacterium paragallinarum]|uniref:Uncharacterized protein n=1 Tax=Avibacterium gallinarum TaxID=755 RepID=A0A379AWR6_AVIGA|nr:hypothetical protein [Avibacterium gallinarum]TDP30153.1 hypothetical protein EV689_101180 [Avibacterium gallinarum]SUB26653.1 Uncharacterised protein [Avibacterium gallinarum]